MRSPDVRRASSRLLMATGCAVALPDESNANSGQTGDGPVVDMSFGDDAVPEATAMELPYGPFGAKSWGAGSAVQNRDNGIVVGQPKLFELRTLQMMIDSVKSRCARCCSSTNR